jgi:hypothetical protein
MAALLPEVEWGVSVTHATLAEDVVPVPLSLEGGVLQVPQGEGIGVVPDLATLRRLSQAEPLGGGRACGKLAWNRRGE